MRPPSRLSEREFMAQVRQLAVLYGWRVFHNHDARRSAHGWPDLVLVRPPAALFVELKTAVGKATVAQLEWLGALRSCGLDARVWRPGDWAEIERTLGRETT